jgi:repressor LexA
LPTAGNGVHVNTMLTETQEAVLSFIEEFQRREGVPPSTRQIAQYFGFKSQTSAMKHLQALAKKGAVEQLAERSWGVRAREVQTHFIPLYGTIPAGRPVSAEQQAEESIAFDPSTHGLSARKQYWALQVSGDSMVGAHIVDGDIAIMEQREPHPGEIIAALVDETTTTLKRYVVEKGRAILRAANPRFPDLFPERLECHGVLVSLIGRGKR